jgi:hypothetical protein
MRAATAAANIGWLRTRLRRPCQKLCPEAPLSCTDSEKRSSSLFFSLASLSRESLLAS